MASCTPLIEERRKNAQTLRFLYVLILIRCRNVFHFFFSRWRFRGHVKIIRTKLMKGCECVMNGSRLVIDVM